MPDRYKETFDTWNKVANLYEDNFMQLELYNDSYDIFCELVKKEMPNILEVGCGPGNITKYLLTKRPDFKISGIDIAPNMVALAEKNNPSASFDVMDSRAIGTIKTKFDGIVCGFILPYLSESDRLKLILDCKELLSNDGILYLSFVEGNYIESDYQSGKDGDRVFFYYHELDKLKSELINNNFQVLNDIKVEYQKGDAIEIHTILIMGKKN